MAKSNKRGSSEKRAKPSVADGKAVFQVRLDGDVHEKLKAAAATAGISMNQLIQGVLRWAGDHVRQGRPTLKGKVVGEQPCGECVWFGHVTKPMGIGERGHEGMFVFMLDYSDRKALNTTLVEDEVDGTPLPGSNEICDGDKRESYEARLRAATAGHDVKGPA